MKEIADICHLLLRDKKYIAQYLGTMKKITPIAQEEFVKFLQTESNNNTVDYISYFKPYIESAINYAIGPYFWFISDNRIMKIIAASDNIRQLSPFDKNEWIGSGPEIFTKITNPDDISYLYSAMSIGAAFHESLTKERRGFSRANIYCRMLDGNQNYRWTLVQYVAHYYNKSGRVESTICMITDLSSFNMIDRPMMTIIDNNNKEHQFFKVLYESKSIVPFELPHVTKREQEILKLMAKGLTTPQIASLLNISYNTVENHKRNIRSKTNTKTSAELIHFVMNNNIL